MRGSFPLNGTYFQVNEVNRMTSSVLLVLLLSLLSQWTHFLLLSCMHRPELKTSTNSIQKLKLMGRGGQFTYIPTLVTLYLSIQVFADHRTSHNPIHVERVQLWNLQRRMVFFGTSVPTIFRGCLPCINNSLKLYLYWY
jgi:hypothetical protein